MYVIFCNYAGHFFALPRTLSEFNHWIYSRVNSTWLESAAMTLEQDIKRAKDLSSGLYTSYEVLM